jgi:4-diphosphocytidyl-2-C-methyl-D-erythritol kinase
VSTERAEEAPAKVNLTLRVIGRRADGLHDIESLVAFAAISDRLIFVPEPELSLAVRGPFGAAASDGGGNLVLKAAAALANRVSGLKVGRFVLTKRLPVAAGLGGGSADAAAALRLLAHANRIALRDPRLLQAARATGADTAVCLDPRARMMQGVGDILSEPLALPRLPAVLVNPGVALSTKEVFAAFDRRVLAQTGRGARQRKPATADVHESYGYEALLNRVVSEANDLEPAAISLCPQIVDVLQALRALSGCRVARMSGSGATCFGLFDSMRAAHDAARELRAMRPDWWVRATVLAGT